MADINAADLTAETLSSLDGTENIVAFDTAEGKKIPLSVLGDYVVQKLTQTLLGQTQSVANAIEQCYSLHGGQIVSSGFNFDTCTDVGNYSIPTTSLANSATGTKPTSVPIGYLKVLRTRDSSNVISQIFYEYSAVAVYYTRNYTVSSQTWSDWVKTPTRAEMDAVTTAIGTFGTTTISTVESGANLEWSSGTLTNGHYLLVLDRVNNSDNTSAYLALINIHTTSHIAEIYKGENAPTDVAVSSKVLTFTRTINTMGGRLIRL